MSGGESVDRLRQAAAQMRALARGYVVRDVHTGALDWDAEVHSTLDEALAELSLANASTDPDDPSPGCCYEVAAITPLAILTVFADLGRLHQRIDNAAGAQCATCDTWWPCATSKLIKSAQQ